MLLALVAFAAQQWAVLTHWHGPGPVTADLHPVALVATDEAPAGGRGPAHQDCLGCHAASHGAAAAPPAQWSGLPVLIAQPFNRPLAATTATFQSSPSWAWHSRGPPSA